MQAISGIYENGKFKIFDENISKNIKKAKLYIVMIPENEESKNISIDNLIIAETSSEEDFKMLGIRKFFNENDDKNIDWEDCFGIR